MAYTISTHNGSAVARGHNVRDRKITDKEAHIDPDGIHEIWRDETERHAYNRLFGKALEDYNAKQSRPDRRIRNYYSHIAKDCKKHTAYEMIIAVGNRDNPVDDQLGKDILRRFVDGWKDRNPNLEMIGAYYHADEEGVPHVHIDYIPVAHGYSRGMETQTGLVKALGQQGFVKKGKATAQIQWQQRENQCLEDICCSYGLEITHPERGKGVQHLATELYQMKQDAHHESADILRQSDQQAANVISKAQNDAKAILHNAISDKQAAIKEQDATISGQKATIEEQDATISGQKATIENQDAIISGQKATIEEQNATISGQKVMIEKQKATLKEYQGDCDFYKNAYKTWSKWGKEEKKSYEELKQENDDLGQAISGQKATIKEQGATISGQQAMIKEQDATISGQKATIKEQDATISGQQAMIKEQDATISGQQAMIKEQDATISGQQFTIEKQKAAISADGEELETIKKNIRAAKDELGNIVFEIDIRDMTYVPKETGQELATLARHVHELDPHYPVSDNLINYIRKYNLDYRQSEKIRKEPPSSPFQMATHTPKSPRGPKL